MIGIAFVPVQYFKQNWTWKDWLNYILKYKREMELSGAAIFLKTGEMLASSRKVSISREEIFNLSSCFQDKPPEMIVIHGTTYCVKSITSSQLTAFNGCRYVIISRTLSIYLVVLCKSRERSTEAAAWLKRVGTKLLEKHH